MRRAGGAVWIAVTICLAAAAGAFIAAAPAVAIVSLAIAASTVASLALLGRLGAGWIPVLIAAAATLLPLVVLRGLPADKYVIIVATAVAAVVLLAHPWRRVPAGLVAGTLLLAIAALLAGNAADGGSPYPAAMRFLTYTVLIAILANLTVEQRRGTVQATIGIVAVLAGSIYATKAGLLSLPQIEDRESTGVRIGGLIGHPNFAAYLMSIAVLYILAHEQFRARYRYLLVGGFAGAILITGSRSALIFLLLGSLILFARWWRHSLLLLAISSALYRVYGDLISQRLDSLTSSGGIQGQNSSGWRFQHWSYVFDQLEPLSLTGVGWSRAQTLLPGQLAVHNGYLQVWFELGLLGLAGLIAFAFALWRLARARGLTAMILVGYAFVTNVGDMVLLYPPIAYVLLILVLGMPSRVEAGAGTTARDASLLDADSPPTMPVTSRKSLT